MPTLTRFFLVSLFLLHAGVSGLHSAEPMILHLRNGDRISGTLLSEDSKRVTLTNAVLGHLFIPLSAIARREGSTNATVATSPVRAPATTASAPTLSPELRRKLDDLTAVYTTGGLSADEFQRQRSQLVKPPKPPGPKRWSVELFAGVDMLFSEKDRQLYTGRIKATYEKAPLRNSIDYLFTYGWADGELTANRMDGSMKTDWDLTPRTYLYHLGGAGYDSIRLIDWRYELGPGLGYHVIKRTNFVARIETGFNYQIQDFKNSRERKTYNPRLAQDVRWNLGPLLSFDEKSEYFPDVENLRAYRLRAEANLRYWLRSNLSLNLTVIDNYDTRTALGVGQNDLQIKSSLGFKF